MLSAVWDLKKAKERGLLDARAPRKEREELEAPSLSPLTELENLKELWISHTAIPDYSLFSQLTNLRSLQLAWISNSLDMTPSSSLQGLEELYIGVKKIYHSHLTPLRDLDSLK